MKILNEEHFQNVKRYAESIGDTSLQNCLDRLKKWEENPDHPSEISLYYDHAPYSFGFTQRYPDGSIGIVGGLWKSHATLTLLAKQDLPPFGYNMTDPLKSWCWGSILFYPFKISRFS